MYIDERQKEVARSFVADVDLMIKYTNETRTAANRGGGVAARERASEYAAIFEGLRQVYYEYPELRLPKGQKVV